MTPERCAKFLEISENQFLELLKSGLRETPKPDTGRK
jgi:hypothetical protein